MLAEILDFFLKMQEAQQDKVGAGAFEVHHAFGNLPRSADQV
jgi:hypothetical protein